MRDDISQQLDGFGADMPAMTWASPEEIRGRGERRRRVRAAGMTTAAVVATVLVAGTAFALGARPGDPAPPATTATPAVPRINTSPSARPALTTPSAGPSVPGSTSADLVIPAGAMLRASDAGPSYRVDDGEYLGENYRYVTGLCLEKGQWDGEPSAPTGTRPPGARRQQVLESDKLRMHLVQQVDDYGSAELARARMAHERAGFEHCAKVDHRETHVTFDVVRRGFAGAESLMVLQSPNVLLVLVRVDRMYIEISIFYPGTPSALNMAIAGNLAEEAVARICAATTAC
ncbi:hypothetical protein AB0B31_22665 [Catellatospora citrea]|uniref:hypothetical protein n=1 Tax=Catellatospora citrea TaxID=53366 RepID=UPI0033D547BB